MNFINLKSQDSSKLKKDSNNNENSTKNNDLPDLINQNGSNDSNLIKYLNLIISNNQFVFLN